VIGVLDSGYFDGGNGCHDREVITLTISSAHEAFSVKRALFRDPGDPAARLGISTFGASYNNPLAVTYAKVTMAVSEMHLVLAETVGKGGSAVCFQYWLLILCVNV